MPHTVITPKAAWICLVLAAGCQASVSADTSVNSGNAAHEQPDESPIYDKPISGQEGTPAAAVQAGPELALLGARHDLALDGSKANVACACMKVGLGGAKSAAFQWQAGAPKLDEATELVVALSPDATTCKDEPKGANGPSYSGYRLSGNDVIVMVESAQSGRPQVAGAIIPKPVGDGQVYVAPAHKKLPYGKALNDPSQPCKVGNVASKRSQPFGEDEIGAAPIARHSKRDPSGNAAEGTNQ